MFLGGIASLSQLCRVLFKLPGNSFAILPIPLELAPRALSIPSHVLSDSSKLHINYSPAPHQHPAMHSQLLAGPDTRVPATRFPTLSRLPLDPFRIARLHADSFPTPLLAHSHVLV